MPIPPFDEHGFLPAGLHECTVNEMKLRFGAFRGSDRRAQLIARLEAFVSEAKSCGLVAEVLVDGSFVTAKNEPNDIDLIVIVPASHSFLEELSPATYNILSK